MRPLVTLHFAQSLDGRIGLGREHQRAILSSDEGLLCAHRARAEHDAVLVGIETVLHDDPLLTARAAGAPQPLRVILDSSLRLPPSARLLASPQSAGGVLVFGVDGKVCSERRAALEALRAQVRVTAPDADGRVLLSEALAALASQGVERLLVEGGASVITSFLRARVAARVQIEISPLFLGALGTPSVRELELPQLSGALKLESVEVERLGPGFLVRGEVVYPESVRA